MARIAEQLTPLLISVNVRYKAHAGLRLVGLPWALPYLGAAARLAAPRAFLGVMIAEWLATGFGIGNLLNESRGMLDYGMIWSVAVVSVIAAVSLHSLVAALERQLLRRRAQASS